ncbi:MAG: PKD domain-containing protein, partial [Ginsengibacter sp.]
YGTADSNYYARPLDDNNMVRTFVPPTTTYYNVSGWSTFTAQDVHSKQSPKTTTTVNDLRFEYNATSSSKTVTLDGNYIDVRNVSYNGTITLAPYSSAVLIRNGAATNQAPTANAGSDQTITLPKNSVTLSGSGTDPDGTISSYAWTKISGPAATITNASSASTSVTGLTQGIYQFQLKVTDNSAATDLDTVVITVNPAANVPPTANAGSNQTITLPTNSVTLSGSGTDPDGTISSYAWTKISGPAATITNTSSASTTVTGLTQGVYQFQLKVTDNSAATDLDTVQITVNPAANVPPTANAGSDQTITLPTNSITLSGSGTDADGTISSYAWTKISGPAATITNASSASTTVTGLVQGTY